VATKIVLDDTVVATARVFDSETREIQDPPITWQSLDPTIVTVENGRVVGVGVGTATVRATSGALSEEMAITVGPYFSAISVGEQHACGIAGDGRTFCWGINTWGQLGRSSGGCVDFEVTCNTRPHLVSNSGEFVQVVAGGFHTCALTGTGVARCWGLNSAGQLGTTTAEQSTRFHVAVAGPVRFRMLALGRTHTCGIGTDGDTYCWGDDSQSQLGLGAPAPEVCSGVFVSGGPCSRSPLRVTGGHRFETLVATERGTCGFTAEGKLHCWGDLTMVERADCVIGTDVDCGRTPVLVSTASFVKAALGQAHGCAIAQGGTLSCSGYNVYGALGNGTTDRSPTLTPTANGLLFSDVAAGSHHTCGIDLSARAYCWGLDDVGQAGASTTAAQRLLPVAVAGGHSFVTLASSASSRTTCSLTTDGRAYCWGDGEHGQRGDGTLVATAAGPQRVRVPRWNY
jgi:alpha-tubulin suppressor-like RCC1 family protein